MLKGGWLLLLLVAATVAASVAASAGAHNDPCHAARTCPSDDHSYVWSGMSCTSSEAKRLPEDQFPVDWRGIRYWCHVVTDTGMGGGTPPVVKPSCKADRAAVATMRDGTAAEVRLAAVADDRRRLARLRLRRAPRRRERGSGAGANAVPARTRGSSAPGSSTAPSGSDAAVTSRPGRRSSPASPSATARSGADADVRAKHGVRTRGARSRLRPRATSRPPSHCAGTATIEAVGFVPSRGTAGAGPVRLELRPVLSFAAGLLRRAALTLLGAR